MGRKVGEWLSQAIEMSEFGEAGFQDAAFSPGNTPPIGHGASTTPEPYTGDKGGAGNKGGGKGLGALGGLGKGLPGLPGGGTHGGPQSGRPESGPGTTEEGGASDSGGGGQQRQPRSSPRTQRQPRSFPRMGEYGPRQSRPGHPRGNEPEMSRRPETGRRAQSHAPQQEGGGRGGQQVQTSGSLAQQRERYKKELEANPRLREKILHIGAGENQDLRANTSVFESMMNRAAMRDRPLAREATLSPRGSAKAGVPNEHGYYEGYSRNISPSFRAQENRNLDAALAGSNVSNYATGNASGSFARNRLARGEYPGGLRSKYNGEYFVGEGARGRGRDSYQGWRDRTQGGGAGTTHIAGGGGRHTAGGQPQGGEQAHGSAPESKGDTLNAVTTGPHGYRNTGDINIGGHHYPFVTGGRGKGAIPYGDYRIGNREIHPKLHGSAYSLTPERGTNVGGRSGFFIHRGGERGSLGCVHISPKQFPAFERDLAQNHYRTLHIGPAERTASNE